jgi:hypothetical protein
MQFTFLLTTNPPGALFIHRNKLLVTVLKLVFVIAVTREPCRFKPSDSAHILQCGSRPFCDLLAKILVVSAQLFLCNTQFY